jgi:RHS repeat-associated protein
MEFYMEFRTPLLCCLPSFLKKAKKNCILFFLGLFASLNVQAVNQLVVQPEPPVLASPSMIPAQDIEKTDQVDVVSGQFRVDESGAATYSIPIMSPLSTAGVAPVVTVSYSSLAGYGPLGRGWSLNASSGISRCRQSILQDANAEAIKWSDKDRFCLDGKRLLVKSGGIYGAVGAEYQTEIDEYIRITSIGGAAGHPDYFKVEGKDGSTTLYGELGEGESELSGRIGGSKGANKVLTWFISRFEDSVGNPITYHYDDQVAYHRLTEVAYSYGSDTVGGMKIRFNYENEASISNTYYVSGYQFNHLGRMKSVEVVNSRANKVLRAYDFSYAGNYLTSVAECVEYKCLPETSFLYGSSSLNTKSSENYAIGGDKMLTYQIFDLNGNGSQSIVWVEQHGNQQKLKYMAGRDSSNNLVFSEMGSFYLSHEDPLSVLDLKILDYNADGRQDVAVFNKNAPAGQKWRIYLASPNSGGAWRLKETNTFLPTSHRSIHFADLNGDGLNDLFYALGSSLSVYYLERDASQPVTSDQFYRFSDAPVNITVPGFNVNATSAAPAGDFNGDGQVDLIISISNSAITGTEQDKNLDWREKKYAFIFDSGSLVHYKELVVNNSYLPVDINGDGLTDLVYSAKSIGSNLTVDWHFVLGTGAGFSGATLIKADSQVRSPKLVDINGDGFVDFLWSTSTSLYARYWNPLEQKFRDQDSLVAAYFSGYDQGGTNSNLDHYPFSILDFDGDGIWDLTFHGKDYSGNPSVVVKLRNGSVNNGKLRRIENGFGKITEIEYKPLNRSGHYTSIQSVNSSTSTNQSCIPGSTGPDGNPICHEVVVNTFSLGEFYRQINDPFSVYGEKTLGGVAAAPILEMVSPAPIVTLVKSSAPTTNNPSQKKEVAYFYHQARAQAGGRGSLGFRKLTTIDLATGLNTTTSYRQDWPFIGLPELTVVKSSKGFEISRSESEYTLYGYEDKSPSFWVEKVEGARLNGTAALGAVGPYANRQREKSYALNNDGDSFGSLIKETSVETVQDQYGNATSIIQHYKENDAVVGITTTTNNYGLSDESRWLGRLWIVNVKQERFGNDVAGQHGTTRASIFSYYGLNDDCSDSAASELDGLLCNEYQVTNEGLVKKRHYYDQFGNTVFTKTTAPGGEERLSPYSEYDQYGRFVEKIYDFIPLVISNDVSPNPSYSTSETGTVIKTHEVTSRDKYGSVTESKSFLDGYGRGNAVVTTVATTDFGKHYFTADSTGAYSIKLSSIGAGVHCPNGTAFHTSVQISGGGKAYECFDLLGREVRSVNQGFHSGVWIYQDKEYNRRGEVARSSKPYKSGENVYWVEFEYDVLGRTISATETINGIQESSAVIYDGYTTRYVNAKGQERSERKNIFGEVVSVSNALGNATYKYNAMGKLVELIDPDQNSTHIEYDAFGRKISMNDPDKGLWRYKYNVFDEIVCQQDAEGYITRSAYDVKGRVVARRDYDVGGNCADPESDNYMSQAMFGYDTQIDGLGKPALVLFTDDMSYQVNMHIYKYDNLGRESEQSIYLPAGPDGGWHYSKTLYDQFGRELIHYDFARNDWLDWDAEGSATLRRYNARGHLSKIQDAHSSLVYYEILDKDAYGNVTESVFGNGIEQSDTYYLDTGLANTQSTNHGFGGNLLHNKVYWDNVGNVNYRELTRNGVTERETFQYDNLNRLKQYQVGNLSPTIMTYDKLGNIKSKSDVANGAEYLYNSSASGPHAVNQIGGVNYTYNANGSLIGDGRGRSLTYTPFDKVKTITQDNRKVQYAYGPDRNRYLRVDEDLSTGQKDYTYYIGNVEKIRYSNGTVKWKRNIGGVAQITRTMVNGAIQSERTSYFHKDYLGSINAITDELGTVIEEFSFDPWGARRASTSVNMTRTAVLSNWWRNSNRTTLRGFTGHEMVDGVDVINMNGRIYDAHIGRFLQADPIVQEVGLIDNLNRYSYVLNNPLNATDPSGYVFNKFIRSFAGTMSHIFGEEVTYAFGATVFGYFGGALGASYWDYQFNRAMGATSSQAFRSSATTFAVSAISYGIGTSGLQGYQKVLAHGVVGGLAAEAQGGDFVAGFFASGVAKGFSEAGGMARVSANGFTGVMTRTAIAAMIGGTVSEMTGGKFANGARTATLQHLFNYETERARAAQKAQGGAGQMGRSSSAPGGNPSNALSTDGGEFKQCMATCLQDNYGETYEWAERVSPVSVQGLLTNEAAEALQDHAQKQANRNAWSADKKTFEVGRRQLGVVKFFSRFNAAAAVAGAGAAGFQAGALGYCAVDCLSE